MLATQIRTASHLRAFIEDAGHAPHYFDRQTMRWFGDTMRNYGVRQVQIIDRRGSTIDAWELYRRRPVKHGLQSSSYWDAETFRRVFPAD